MTFPDPEDLDGCRGERPARRGHGHLRPYFSDHHLRVLGLVNLRHLVVLQPQRRLHDTARVLADRLPALQAHGRARWTMEGELDYRVGREQVSEAVGIAVQ